MSYGKELFKRSQKSAESRTYSLDDNTHCGHNGSHVFLISTVGLHSPFSTSIFKSWESRELSLLKERKHKE